VEKGWSFVTSFFFFKKRAGAIVRGVCGGRMDSKGRAGYLDDGRALGDGEANGVEG
jgi:hypothetical protein